MKRIALFLATNIAVLLVVTVVFRLLGLESILAQSGTSLDLQSLLIYSAVVGNGGVEQLTHGGLVRYIRYNRIERTGASPDRTEQRLDVSPGEHDGPTVARQRQRDSRADAAAGAGNHGDSRRL